VKVLVIIHSAGILDGRKPVQIADRVTYHTENTPETVSLHKQTQQRMNLFWKHGFRLE